MVRSSETGLMSVVVRGGTKEEGKWTYVGRGAVSEFVRDLVKPQSPFANCAIVMDGSGESHTC